MSLKTLFTLEEHSECFKYKAQNCGTLVQSILDTITKYSNADLHMLGATFVDPTGGWIFYDFAESKMKNTLTEDIFNAMTHNCGLSEELLNKMLKIIKLKAFL